MPRKWGPQNEAPWLPGFSLLPKGRYRWNYCLARLSKARVYITPGSLFLSKRLFLQHWTQLCVSDPRPSWHELMGGSPDPWVAKIHGRSMVCGEESCPHSLHPLDAGECFFGSVTVPGGSSPAHISLISWVKLVA